MASVGFDQFWADAKPEDPSVTPKKKTLKISQISSMSTPQGTSVTRGSTLNMQQAAKRKLKKYQQDTNTDDKDYRF